MTKRAVRFAKNSIYHVYNRGIRKQPVFVDKNDYLVFLERMFSLISRYSIDLISFCLMPNHFHLLIKQLTNQLTVADFMQNLGLCYSKYFNQRHNFVGSLFQGRYKAKHVDSTNYLINVSRYIHQNPWDLLNKVGCTKTDLMRMLISYPWSSYKTYLGQEAAVWCKKINTTEIGAVLPIDRYIDLVEQPITHGEIDVMQEYLLE